MKFLLKPHEIKNIYSHNGNSGCLASNRITVDGMKVGYMYREEGSESFPDSGWRIFAGDENQEYVDDPRNFNLFDLNTICNYDEIIIPYLDAEIGSSFVRNGDEFIKET